MNKVIYIALIVIFLSIVSISAGCISSNDANNQDSITNTESSQSYTYNDSNISNNTQKYVIADAMPRGEYYEYTDNTRDNNLKVTVVKDTGKIISSLDILNPSLDERVTLTPELGNMYYYVFVSYTHTGVRDIDNTVQVTTPPIAFHRLYDKEGNMYRPMQLNVGHTYSFFGKYYQQTVLDRLNNEKDMKSFKGYLIYEVPSDFTPEGAYLTINLGKWGTPAWKLWE